MDSLTLNRDNSFQNKNNRKATHSFALGCNKKFRNSIISASIGAHQKLTWIQTFQTFKIKF